MCALSWCSDGKDKKYKKVICSKPEDLIGWQSRPLMILNPNEGWSQLQPNDHQTVSEGIWKDLTMQNVCVFFYCHFSTTLKLLFRIVLGRGLKKLLIILYCRVLYPLSLLLLLRNKNIREIFMLDTCKYVTQVELIAKTIYKKNQVFSSYFTMFK